MKFRKLKTKKMSLVALCSLMLVSSQPMTAHAEAGKNGNAQKAGITAVKQAEDAASITLTAAVTMDGNVPADGRFRVCLRDAAGNVLQEQTNQGGIVTFDALHFDKPGSYHYTMVQRIGNDSGVTYDETIYGIVITVTDTEQSDMTVVYVRNGQFTVSTPAFANSTKAAGVDESSILQGNQEALQSKGTSSISRPRNTVVTARK